MRVLVTRPQAQAARSAERLRVLGHEPVLLPLSRAIHRQEGARAALAQLHCALAVTSAEALRVLAHLPPLPQDALSLPFFAIGPASGKAAMELGFSNIVCGSGDGGNLAGIVVEHLKNATPEAPLLYLAGAPRAGRFERMLQNRELSFITAEIYRMVKVRYGIETLQACLIDQRVDVVLLYSHENARAFFDLPIFAETRAALGRVIFLCLSQTIANTLPDGYRRHAQVAATPDEDALFDLL